MLDTVKLKNFLESLKKEDFWNNTKIKEANTIDDLLKFGYEGILDGDTIVNYGEYFLVDYYGNDLTVVVLTKRAYKNSRGRKVKCKPLFTIIEDCKSTFGSCLNGYWKIPNEFLKESK